MTDTVDNVITVETITEIVTEVVVEPIVTREVLTVAEPELLVEQLTLSEVLEVYGIEMVTETVPQVETITECGQQGPPGPAGPSGSLAQSLTRLAGETLGGHRAVFVASDGSFRYADNLSDAAAVVAGITVGAAANGESVVAQYAGEMVEPSWSWVPELPIFLGSNGQLTQTPPSTGNVVELGVALSPTSILIRVQATILLE